LVVSSSTVAHVVDVVLRPMSAIDPPVLMALLDVRTTALEASRAS